MGLLEDHETILTPRHSDAVVLIKAMVIFMVRVNSHEHINGVCCIAWLFGCNHGIGQKYPDLLSIHHIHVSESIIVVVFNQAFNIVKFNV